MDVVEEVKRRIDPVDYIGRVVTLQKSGRNFKAVCPFHAEKTPSFYVFPDRGTWRCFGACGEGGDLFTFVQKRENVDFRTALRELAREAGVQLSAEAAAQRSRSDHLGAVVSAAVDYYQRQFADPVGATARQYVHDSRGLSEAAVDAFRIGWAPDQWRGLRDFLGGRGYTDADGIAAGLLVESESGGSPYDRFRGRVIIPIADERGNFVGIGGRALGDEQPKYLNSPQTEIFDKGRTLFGLNLAGDAIRQSGTVVVVEGYMDVIGPWQADFRNVVATMGTSLTEQHVGLLRRSARRIVLAMDPDAAGMRAAERAGGLLLAPRTPEDAGQSARAAQALTTNVEVELRVAPLPPGKDPDEVARHDPDGWRRAVEQAPQFAEFLIDRLLERDVDGSPVEARRAVDQVRPILQAVRDPVERAMYVQRLARHLGTSEQAVSERIGRRRPGASSRQPEPALGRNSPNQETFLLATLLRFDELRPAFGPVIPEQFFSDALEREIFVLWRNGGERAPAGDPVDNKWIELEELRLPPFTIDRAREDVRRKIERIKRERDIAHLAAAAERMAEIERETGSAAVASIGSNAWRGVVAAPGDREAAEIVLELQQLSQSMHRHEDIAETP